MSRKRPPVSKVIAHPDATLAELATKLWGGFSRYARPDLDYAVRSERAGTDRAFAAWELAKFCAFETHWQQALHYLEIIREINEDLLHRRDVSLLYIEALTACGQSDEAERHVGRHLDEGKFDADYYCALSNVMSARPVRERGEPERDLARLALLNRMFRESNLEEVSLLDPARGFTFGNLSVVQGCLPAIHQPEKISALLTAHNAEALLSAAVVNILGQTWRNLELVVVDDASTDSSWKIVERLATQDPRIVCVRNAVSKGVYQARNRALSLATGDFIATFDCDEWCHPQMLQTQVQAMRMEPETRLAFPGEAWVSPDMKYVLRLRGNSTEYLRRSSRTSLIRRRDFQWLDKWDGVAAHADDEFVQRARAIWGDQAVRDVFPNVPMALRLKLSTSRRSMEEPDFRSPTSATRQEYARQAEFWRRTVLRPTSNAARPVPVERVSTKQPFPIPGSLAPKHWKRDEHYNLIVISDLTLLGGTRRCNEGYVAAATSLGMRVGLLHWARYDLRLAADIAKEYRILSYGENVDILTADDRVSTDLLIVHHPPIMKYVPDDVPRISTEKLAILVNQLPLRFGEEDNEYYVRRDVEAACLRLFGLAPVWIPISPLVRRILSEDGFAPLAEEDWVPPLGRIVIPGDSARSPGSRQSRTPVIGRHSRDHPSKWPAVEKDLRAAYCADTELPVRLLGGATFARRVLSRWPQNWEELAFDSIAVGDFLHALDFFVHFPHSAYVEEFGRNIMEAMAAGVPAVAPWRFREVFGDAACYAEPEEVKDLISNLWNARSAYAEQVDKGFHFVREFASNERVERRLEKAIHGTI